MNSCQQLLYDVTERTQQAIKQIDHQLRPDEHPEHRSDMSKDCMHHAVDELLGNIHADGRREAAQHADRCHAKSQAFVGTPDQPQHTRQAGKGREDVPDFELLFFFFLLFFVAVFFYGGNLSLLSFSSRATR